MTAPMTSPPQGGEVDPLSSRSTSLQNPARTPPLATARLDEAEFLEVQYASFLVRLWRREEPRPNGSTDEWQGEVEHIQSGRRWGFDSLAELWRLLGQPLVASKGQPESVQ